MPVRTHAPECAKTRVARRFEPVVGKGDPAGTVAAAAVLVDCTCGVEYKQGAQSVSNAAAVQKLREWLNKQGGQAVATSQAATGPGDRVIRISEAAKAVAFAAVLDFMDKNGLS